MTLRSNVHALTRDHLTNTPFGTATVPPLIRQLEAAIRPDKGGGKSGKSGGGDIINMTALALWEEISADVRIYTIEAGLTPKPDRMDTLQLWATLDDDTEWCEYLTHLTMGWCDRIAALLSPLKPWHPAQPCPACGQRFHGPESSPTLNVHYLGDDGHPLHPEQWRMECQACETQWEGDTLGAVALAMSA